MNVIQESNVKNEYFVKSIQNANICYIINSKIETYKHQNAVSVKFYILIFNFLSSLTCEKKIFFHNPFY